MCTGGLDDGAGGGYIDPLTPQVCNFLLLSHFLSKNLKCTILRQDRLGTDVRKVETKDRFAAQPKELPHWTLELAFPLHGSATHGGAENPPPAPISTTFLMCIPSLFWQIIVLHERN